MPPLVAPASCPAPYGTGPAGGCRGDGSVTLSTQLGDTTLVLQGHGAGDDFRYIEPEDTDCNAEFPNPWFNTDHFAFPPDLQAAVIDGVDPHFQDERQFLTRLESARSPEKHSYVAQVAGPPFYWQRWLALLSDKLNCNGKGHPLPYHNSSLGCALAFSHGDQNLILLA